MKVLGIFVFYDRRKEVKKYVKFLIQEIKKYITDLIIVCNGEVSDLGKCFFEENAQNLLIRLNEGYDAGAYQDAILNYIGIEKIKGYDALLLFNNSFYGPIYPFEDMFVRMQRENWDFWGITAGGYGVGNNTPYHIQSYFIMISSRILRSCCFEEYWRTQEKCKTFQDAVEKFELRFTNYFLENGFTCGTYIKREEIEKIYNMSGNILCRLGHELIFEYKVPVLKRKHIMLDMREASYQNNADILKYIDDYTDYNVDFIWDDIIKDYTPYDLNLRRFLKYIVSPYLGKEYNKEKMVIIIYSAYHRDYINFLNQYVKNVKIIVIISGEKFYDTEKEVEFYFANDKCDFWDVLRNILSDNRLESEICIVADQFQFLNEVDRKRALEDICNKLLYSSDYVRRVHELFEEHHRLGILLPEPEYNFSFFEHIGKRNRLGKKNVETLSALQYDFLLDQNEKIIENQGCFWCRPQVFGPLFVQGENIDYTKEEIMPVLPHLARKAGYFTAIVNNAQTMGKEYSLKCQIIDRVFEVLNVNTVYSDLEEGLSNLLKEGIVEFACRYEGVYIYGAGVYGGKCLEVLSKSDAKICGFLVSDDIGIQQVMNYQIWNVDDIDLGKSEAILVALSKKNQSEVYEKLKKFPQERIYYI